MIKRIFSKLNGNPKTLSSRKELIHEISTYKSLNSITLTIEFNDGKTINLSILSATWFIITGEIQENILNNKKLLEGQKNDK